MSSKYTQQHYEDMARILREARTEPGGTLARLAREADIANVEYRLVTLFAEDNPRFSVEKFAKAARPEPGTDPSALDFEGAGPPEALAEVLFQVTRAGADEMAGRPVTDEEAARIAKALPCSSIPDSVGEVIWAITGDPE